MHVFSSVMACVVVWNGIVFWGWVRGGGKQLYVEEASAGDVCMLSCEVRK